MMTNTPSDAEIDEVTLDVLGYAALDKETNETARMIARAVLAKWGSPQPAPAPLSEREAFEAWIEKDGGDLGTFGTPPNMHYRNSSVNNAWVAWKARAALAAQGGKCPMRIEP